MFSAKLTKPMKLNYPREWFEEKIERDGKVEIGAGFPEPQGAYSAKPSLKLRETRIAFGQFVEL